MEDMNREAERPLHVKVKQERKRQMLTDRDLTQEYVANEAGMKKRAYQYFEAGKHTPQREHLEGILRVLGLDANGDPLEAATIQPLPTTQRRQVMWPEDIDSFFNMWGLYLLTMEPAERENFIHDATRWVVNRQAARHSPE